MTVPVVTTLSAGDTPSLEPDRDVQASKVRPDGGHSAQLKLGGQALVDRTAGVTGARCGPQGIGEVYVSRSARKGSCKASNQSRNSETVPTFRTRSCSAV